LLGRPISADQLRDLRAGTPLVQHAVSALLTTLLQTHFLELLEPARGELIRVADEHGVTLTSEKLHRWKKAGLLPAPEVLSLGRALGRPALYPPTALAQVLMIAALLKRSR
jgi:hypothetical protein